MLVWPSVEVQELRERKYTVIKDSLTICNWIIKTFILLESPNLLQLHNDFLKMLQEHDIEIISFGETKPTRVTALKVPFRFVNPSSAGKSNIKKYFISNSKNFSVLKLYKPT